MQLPLSHSSDVTDMEARDGEDSVCPVSVAVYQEQCAVNAVYSVEINYIDGNLCLIVFPWSEEKVYLNSIIKFMQFLKCSIIREKHSLGMETK